MFSFKHILNYELALYFKGIIPVLLLLIIINSFAQDEGDYQSYQSGNWQSASNWEVYSSGAWIAAANYPSEVEGEYTVNILYGHEISISSAGISTQNFANLIISGKLILNGSNSPIDFIINTRSIYVTPWLSPYATIEFINKSALRLPENATIKVWTGGLSGDCNNNLEIYIGYGENEFAACNGAPGDIFTFAELMQSGGTLNAEISSPISGFRICLGETVSLSGSYLGAIETSPTYYWSSSGPANLTFISSNSDQNPTTTPTLPGNYTIKLSVSTNNEGTIYTNTDSIEVIVEASSTDPISSSATSTTIMLGNSTILTLNGGGGGTTEQIFWYSGSCGGELVGTGNNILVSPTEETTYFGRYENAAPCNYATACAQITVNVIPFANVWKGNINTDFGTAANWQGNIVPTIGEDIIFDPSPTNNCLLDRDFTVGTIYNTSDKDFIVGDNSFEITNAIDFSGTGNILANSSLSKIIFSGTSSQLIPSSHMENQTITNLEINNIAGVTLAGSLAVTKELKLSDGNLSILSNTLEVQGSLNYINGDLVGGNNSNLIIHECETNIYLQAVTVNNLNLNSSNGLSLSGDITINGSLQLEIGTLSINSHKLTIGGIIERTSGVISAESNFDLIEFANSLDFSIPLGCFSGEVNSIRINGAGITLSENLTITKSLEFISGNISTGNNVVVFTENCIPVTGAGPYKCINGYCRKIGNTSFEFPVGTDIFYAPISISDAQGGGNSSDYFTASYHHQMPHELYDSTQYEEEIIKISEKEFWILNRFGTNNVTVTLSWDYQSGLITSLPDLTVARWDGSMWNDEGNVITTGNTKKGTIKSNYISDFSPFTLASKDYHENLLLPIELVNFYGICSDFCRDIRWETISEINNDFFELEWSPNGKEWYLLDKVDGAGNANSVSEYLVKDFTNFKKQTFYRLKQYDFDATCHSLIMIYQEACPSSNNTICEIYPNPSASFINIEVADFKSVVLTNTIGTIIIMETIPIINVSDLTPGIYIANIYHEDKQTIKRIIVK